MQIFSKLIVADETFRSIREFIAIDEVLHEVRVSFGLH